MRKTLTIACLTVLALLALDGVVNATLAWADRTGRLGSLVYFFEYGRSVPGKLARWEDRPDMVGNLYDIGWRADTVAHSTTSFKKEPGDKGSVIRGYGMSFTLNIREQAIGLRPNLTWDSHAGPAGPPNFTYALFQDDRANRRAGDVALLGILSSVVPTMAAMSNQTRVFEQPAPLTYPIYRPDDGDGLIRIDPLVTSPRMHRALAWNPQAQAAWHNQLAREDAYYSPVTFGLTWLDASPFARLVRRALAQAHIADTTAHILKGTQYPYTTVLPRMIRDFAQSARADGQIPVILLVQTNKRFDPDVLAIAKPVLDAEQIPYLATAELFDPQDLSGFLGDGHYTPEVDRMFAKRLLEIIDHAQNTVLVDPL